MSAETISEAAEAITGIASAIEAAARVAVAPEAADPAVEGTAGLRPEVLAFAHIMERRLRENDHKPGWKEDGAFALLKRVGDEYWELRDSLVCLDRDDRQHGVGEEAADLANFAMMIADVSGSLDLTAALARSVGPDAVEAEREACAEVADEEAAKMRKAAAECPRWGQAQAERMRAKDSAMNIADAIRARALGEAR